MQKKPLEYNYGNQRHQFFENSKVDLFLKDLNIELNSLSYKNNIEYIYNNFTITLSTSINKFSIEVLCRKKNRIVIPLL
jgi:hypothetical protein